MIRDEHEAAFERFDVLVSPTSPTVAFELGARTENPLAMYAADLLTIPSNMAGLPGLSIPCGLSEGLPVGFQLIGPQFSENLLFRTGHALERALDVRLRPGAAQVSWEPVIGLEIHVHLKTRTKMFCRCEVAYFDPPNTHTCPVCLALPGALPVPNRQAVEWTILLGHALGCQIPERAIFHRKNYFYPDNPKGYQISQYDQPLCVNGSFEVPGADADRVVGIERAHLEEDAAKTIHVGGAEGRIRGAEHSLVDFNRSGTPLVEIVTRPDIRSPERGEGVPAAAPADDRRARHLGRGDGEGLAALRRQRLGAARGLRRAAHADRAEEHELVQLRRQGDRARGAAADRDLRVGRRRSSRRRCTSTRATSRRRRCARRRRRRTTATSPSPTSCRSSRPRSWSSACARSCRSCRRRGCGGSRRRSASRSPRGW